MKKQQGFTLIELVMVIVILGILAATALPKFASLQSDARIASIQAASGSMKAAMAITHAQALIDGIEASSSASVSLEGTTINMEFGYPTGVDIDEAAGISSDDYTIMSAPDGSTTVISLQTNCSVTYTAATNATTPATVSAPTTSGC